MQELIKIENTINIKGNDLQVVEYKGVRVLSSYDIARLHDKEVRAVNQQFERNKDRLKEGVDYFLVDKGEFSESQTVMQDSIPNNVKDIKLFTERGYLKLVKSFTDDLSWEVQDLLVDSYFKLQEVLSPKQSLLLNILTARDDLSRAVAINDYEVGYVQPLENKVEEQAEVITKQKPKITYYDLVLQCEDLVPISHIAKDFGLSAQKLNKILAEEKVQYKDKSGLWMLYAGYLANNYAQTSTHVYTTPDGFHHAKLHLKWTQKGRLFIYDMLKARGILPVCERE